MSNLGELVSGIFYSPAFKFLTFVGLGGAWLYTTKNILSDDYKKEEFLREKDFENISGRSIDDINLSVATQLYLELDEFEVQGYVDKEFYLTPLGAMVARANYTDWVLDAYEQYIQDKRDHISRKDRLTNFFTRPDVNRFMHVKGPRDLEHEGITFDVLHMQRYGCPAGYPSERELEF